MHSALPDLPQSLTATALPTSCLQYLGHPIANDTQYGGTWGAPLAFRRLHGHRQQQGAQSQGQGQGQPGQGQHQKQQVEDSLHQRDGQLPASEALPHTDPGRSESKSESETALAGQQATKKARLGASPHSLIPEPAPSLADRMGNGAGSSTGECTGGGTPQYKAREAARSSLISAALDVEGLPQAVQELYQEPRFRVPPELEDTVSSWQCQGQYVRQCRGSTWS